MNAIPSGIAPAYARSVPDSETLVYARELPSIDGDMNPGPIDGRVPPVEAPPEKPFVKGAGDQNTVDPNDVKQNGYGSCGVMSTLRSIAQQDPAAIERMIKDNGDGTYTVTFKEKVSVFGIDIGWKDVDVTVKGPFDTGGASHPGDVNSEGKEVWPAIIEKAYAQQYKSDDATYKTGVLPNEVMEHVLGEKAQSAGTGSLSAGEMSDKLAKHESVVAWTPGFKDKDGNWNPEVTQEQRDLIDHYGIAGGHAYAVTEVIHKGTVYTDPKTGQAMTAKEDMVALGNPWGSGDVTMSYSDYQKVFGWVASAPTN